MKKQHYVFIFVFIALILSSRYGYILYGGFGIDVAGYVADQDGKRSAYALLGSAKQAEIDQCFEGSGFSKDPDKLREEILDLKRSGKQKEIDQIKKCLEEKVSGYASPKKDVKGLLGLFKSTPQPTPTWKKVGEMSYTPNKPGWTRVVKQNLPGGEGVCRIETQYGYRQFFYNLNRTEYVKPGGWPGAADIEKLVPKETPLAQLIMVNNQIFAVSTPEFPCDDTVEAQFTINVQPSNNGMDDFGKNEGVASFILTKKVVW